MTQPVPSDPELTSDRSRRQRLVIVVLVALMIVAGVTALLVWPEDDDGEAEASGNNATTVEPELDENLDDFGPGVVIYQVDGSAEFVTIELTTPEGTQVDRDVPLPVQGNIEYRISMEPGSEVTLTASNGGRGGSVICRIVTEGEVIDHQMDLPGELQSGPEADDDGPAETTCHGFLPAAE